MIILGYVDPGLGLLAWQTVVAFFVGMLFYVRKSREYVLGLARKCVRIGTAREENRADVNKSKQGRVSK